MGRTRCRRACGSTRSLGGLSVLDGPARGPSRFGGLRQATESLGEANRALRGAVNGDAPALGSGRPRVWSTHLPRILVYALRPSDDSPVVGSGRTWKA